MSSDGPRLALAIVRWASRLVPRPMRAGWMAEWEGELWARWDELDARSGLTRRSRLDLLVRAAGSVVDARNFGRSYGSDDAEGGWRMRGFGQEVGMAGRTLLRHRAFAAVVVTTLAIAIGASTAIFGIARDVLLRPFPYPDPEQVVVLQDVRIGRGEPSTVSYPNIADLAAAATSFEEIGAAQGWMPALDQESGSVVLRGATVTPNFFEILGTEAGAGRFFRPTDGGEGRPPSVVLAHRFWVERFGADPGVVGRDILLSGLSYRVIGITAADFEDPWITDGPGAEPQVWRTVTSEPSEWPRSGRSWRGLGRLRDDTDLDVAQEELRAIFARLVEAYPEHNAGYDVRVTPLKTHVTGPVQPVLYLLLASGGALLLIASTNLANVFIGRALDRRREMAVYRAFGASTWRIVSRSLVETALLVGAGGVGGVALAIWLGALATRLTGVLPRPVTGVVDGTVLAFTIVITVAAGMLCGIGPAFQVGRIDRSAGGEGGRWSTGGRATQRVRRWLVVGQLALTTTLLIAAGLLGRSLYRLASVDLGLRTDGVVGVPLHSSAWSGLSEDAAQAKWDAVLAAVRGAPGVTAAGAIDYVPLGGDYSCDGVERGDLAPPAPGEGRCAEVRVVLPGALEAMDVPLLRGRMLDRSDDSDQPPVVVIDENMARAFWPGADPLGASIRVHLRTHEVVGVVGNMLHFGPGGEARPMLYLHAAQEGWNGIARGLTVVARGSDERSLPASVRAAVAGVDPSIALGEPTPLSDLLDERLTPPRLRTYVVLAFGSTGLLLSVLGVAGLMAYSVARRRRELGVRLALGAQEGEVRGLVLREAMRLVGIGVGIGSAGALGVAGMLEALLFDVDTRDPLVYAGAVTVLVLSALLACYVPARRASRVDPVEALAAE
ncbi:MAG: ABC transporter permease [Gemmatimonadales bacterium]